MCGPIVDDVLLPMLHCSEVRRPHGAETLAIGSGPLPARAPPEKKQLPLEKKLQQPTVSAEQPKTVPQPVPPPVLKSVDGPQSVTGVKSAITLPGVPKLTLPIPMSSRASLQPVGRGVSEVFGEQEDIWDEPTEATRPGGKPLDLAALRDVTMAGDALGRAMLPDRTNRPVGVSGEKEAAISGKNSSIVPPSRTGSDRDTVLRPTGDKGELAQQGLSGGALNAKSAAKLPGQHRSRDAHGRKKLEIGRNVM